MQNQYFRILALSATPGNKIDNVHEVSKFNAIYRYLILLKIDFKKHIF